MSFYSKNLEQPDLNSLMKHVPVGRLIPWDHASGSRQMAADAYLLEQRGLHPEQGPVLRFYGWDQDTLSLGYHQDIGSIPSTPAMARIPWVRRPTGGRAVLHQASSAQAELTYSLVMSLPHPCSRTEGYHYLCQFLRQGMQMLGIQLQAESTHRLARRSDRTYGHSISCFASNTTADLTWQGCKVIGSAQLWRDGIVLQHGSILLQPDRDLWESVLPGSTDQIKGIYEILGTVIPISEIITTFVQAASDCFPYLWREQDWFPRERQQISLKIAS
jgi:lipoate-protein ligase A